MSRRSPLVGVLAIVLLVSLTVPTLAGGFAVVHLDEEPGEVPAATPWRFGFTVLQHDLTPNSDVTPVLRAFHKETGEEVTATGVQEGPVGHFVAEVAFPRAGEWKWFIEPQPFAETSFATLIVVESSALRSWPVSPWARYLLNPSRTGGQEAAAQYRASDSQIVEILDPWAFAPFSLQIPAGTAVIWVNRSEATHVVTGDDLAFDDSGPIAPGLSFTATFEEPGTYRYRCSPHPGMVGEIVVT